MEKLLWFEKEGVMRTRDRQVSIRCYTDYDKYICSCVVPCRLYPLSQSEYRLFHMKNTVPLTNKLALEAFNAVKYEVGQCYDNTERMMDEFQKRGLKLQPYCGYLFIEGTGYPVFHSFGVFEEENGLALVDLADDYSNMVKAVSKVLDTDKDARDIFVEYNREAMKKTNVERCSPVGVAPDAYLYVAAPCTPFEAQIIRDKLLDEFPDHPCFLPTTTSPDGLTETQRALKKKD